MAWYEFGVDTDLSYRYLYLRAVNGVDSTYDGGSQWNGALAEVEFYGFNEADVKALNTVPGVAIIIR